VPEKSVRIEIIIEKVKKTNRNPERDDIISRSQKGHGSFFAEIFFSFHIIP